MGGWRRWGAGVPSRPGLGGGQPALLPRQRLSEGPALSTCGRRLCSEPSAWCPLPARLCSLALCNTCV